VRARARGSTSPCPPRPRRRAPTRQAIRAGENPTSAARSAPRKRPGWAAIASRSRPTARSRWSSALLRKRPAIPTP